MSKDKKNRPEKNDETAAIDAEEALKEATETEADCANESERVTEEPAEVSLEKKLEEANANAQIHTQKDARMWRL